MKTVALLLLVTATLKDVNADDTYCYSDDPIHPQNTHFDAKTAYQFVKGSDYAKLTKVPNCQPTKIWFLIRHGTRLPDTSVIDSFSILEELRDRIISNKQTSTLCPGDIDLLKNWKLDKNITANYAEFLTFQGWDDLKLLGADFQKIYPTLFPKKYDAENYLFRHTDTQRTQASFRAFTEGIFGPSAYENIQLDPIPKNDTLLAPFRTCDDYKTQTLALIEKDGEIDKFQRSELMQKVLEAISKRLGFNTTLTFEEVATIYNICRFDQAWYIDKPSPWCSIFNMTEIEVFEYLDDMGYQYKYGYSGPFNKNLPCESIQDMLKHLDNDDEPQAVVYFSHAELVQLFLVGLGAYNDSSSLKADNYGLMGDRKWRISLLTPFAANIAVVKYNCTESDHEKVVIFLNQKPLELDWCNEGLCEWSEFLSKYSRYYHADCANEYCTANTGIQVQVSQFIILVFIMSGLAVIL